MDTVTVEVGIAETLPQFGDAVKISHVAGVGCHVLAGSLSDMLRRCAVTNAIHICAFCRASHKVKPCRSLEHLVMARELPMKR